MEIVGKLFEKHDTVKRTETFSVREFIVEVENQRNPQYNDFVLFQLTNANCDRIEPFNIGDEIQVTFDVRGRRWTSPEGRVAYFNTLNAWRIEAFNGGQQPFGAYPPQPNSYPQQSGYPQQAGGYQQPQPAYNAYQQQPQQAAPQAQPQAQPMGGNMNGMGAAGDSSDDLPF